MGLEFIFGTVCAGKTKSLISYVNYAKESGYKYLILKPEIDTKGGDRLLTHDGEYVDTDYLIKDNDLIGDIIQNNDYKIDYIFIDEVQFLNEKQIADIANTALLTHINIICWGLKSDFTGKMFESSKLLLKLANINYGIKSFCECGRIASLNGRFVNGELVTSGKRILIDGEESVTYKPLCYSCYFKGRPKDLLKYFGIIKT